METASRVRRHTPRRLARATTLLALAGAAVSSGAAAARRMCLRLVHGHTCADWESGGHWTDLAEHQCHPEHPCAAAHHPG